MIYNPFVLALCCCYFGFVGVLLWGDVGNDLMMVITGLVAIILIVFYICVASNMID